MSKSRDVNLSTKAPVRGSNISPWLRESRVGNDCYWKVRRVIVRDVPKQSACSSLWTDAISWSETRLSHFNSLRRFSGCSYEEHRYEGIFAKKRSVMMESQKNECTLVRNAVSSRFAILSQLVIHCSGILWSEIHSKCRSCSPIKDAWVVLERRV